MVNMEGLQIPAREVSMGSKAPVESIGILLRCPDWPWRGTTGIDQIPNMHCCHCNGSSDLLREHTCQNPDVGESYEPAPMLI
jgi:hypothetical protein